MILNNCEDLIYLIYFLDENPSGTKVLWWLLEYLTAGGRMSLKWSLVETNLTGSSYVLDPSFLFPSMSFCSRQSYVTYFYSRQQYVTK